MAKQLTPMERETFQKIRDKYPNKVISPFTLRLEDKIENAKTKYIFKLLQEDGGALKSEVRLNKNDTMFVTAMGLGIYQRNATNAASTSECVEPVQTYPNETYFTTGGVFVVDHLEVFYNARLYMLVGSTTYIPGVSTRDFKYVPQTQQSAATNKSQVEEGDGFVEFPAYYILSGENTTELSLEIQAFTGMVIANDQANTENRVVLFLKGFLIKQGANLPG